MEQPRQYFKMAVRRQLRNSDLPEYDSDDGGVVSSDNDDKRAGNDMENTSDDEDSSDDSVDIESAKHNILSDSANLQLSMAERLRALSKENEDDSFGSVNPHKRRKRTAKLGTGQSGNEAEMESERKRKNAPAIMRSDRPVKRSVWGYCILGLRICLQATRYIDIK